jgi:hypothetical protein
MNLENVYLVVDDKIVKFLQSRNRSEIVSFTGSCIKGVASDVVNDVANWQSRRSALPSVVMLPGPFLPGKIPEFLSTNCGRDHSWSLDNCDIAVKTGTTTFGGKFAVCLVVRKPAERKSTPPELESNLKANKPKNTTSDQEIPRKWWQFWK